jgi:hypothetical protein
MIIRTRLFKILFVLSIFLNIYFFIVIADIANDFECSLIEQSGIIIQKNIPVSTNQPKLII